MNSDYLELLRRSKELAILQSCSAVLQWDQQTYMPRAGAGLRGEQLALLARQVHTQLTDPAIGGLLSACEQSELMNEPDSFSAADIREMRRQFDRATKIPARLVEELARVTTEAHEAWVQARAKNDFVAFRPWLEKILALKREEADAVGYSEHPYDALLDEYEPGAKTSELKLLFSNLTEQLQPLIQSVASSSRKPDRSLLERDFPVERQRIFAESAAAAMGFDFQAGRLDVTTHPFCSGFGPGDCRITTRYNPKFFSEAFFGVLHEAGHGLYEQNLPHERFGSPSATFCSLGIHESQSRLWENQVGRSSSFWKHFFPRLKQTFPAMHDVRLEDFHFAINDIHPSFIRVEADEATYNLHIALRFELELDLLTGELPVAHLPSAWNSQFRKLFGITPPSDREGCLQDIHWSFGGIGYFPTYTLGNLYAAQLMEAARSQLGMNELDQEFQQGDFHRLKDWLIQNVHRHGRRYHPDELCRQATGRALKVDSWIRYLREKLSNLYGIC